MLFIIYPGSSGLAGSYLHYISQAIVPLPHIIYTNYYYPFKSKSSKNIFYKHTEMCGPNIFKACRLLRLAIRYLEFIYSCMFILIDTLKLRPRVVNYNLNQGIQAEYYLLLLIKLLAGAKIVTTVHDVIPFSRKNASKFKTAEIFARIFALSDALIFHSDETKTTFQNEYPVYRDKTSYIYPFPPMTFNIDLAPLHSSNNPEVVKFLFIGHIRNEKGVKCMLEAWEQLARAGNNSSLEIAGNTSEYSDLDYLIQTVQSLNNITLDLRYLSDALFIEKIKSCDVVLLPYEQSSNTGLPFIAASYGKQVIASSLPVFEPYVKSSIIQSELIFDCGSSISLLEKLILASNQIKAGDPQPNIKALNDYINHFGRYTRLTYSKLLSLR